MIPTHSYILGAWVEAGILGVPIWIYLMWLIVRALYAILKQHLFPNVLVTLAGFSLLWDIPFSPFGTSSRFLVPAQICIMLAALRSLKSTQRDAGAPVGASGLTGERAWYQGR